FVGAVIVVVVLAWAGYQLMRPGDTILQHLLGPTKLLPLLGPLVLVIIPAKSFRPKHRGDYWGLQLIGLMAVALGCALASDTIVSILAAAYSLFAVRCVIDFNAIEMEEGTTPGISRGIRWIVLAAFLGVIGSLITPRIGETPWDYGTIANRFRTGISDDRPSIDLNHSGELRSSSEEAFVVTASLADGRPKLDVSPDQKWRGVTFNYYDRGRWENRRWVSAGESSRGRNKGPDSPRPFVPRGRPGFPFDAPTSLPRLSPQEYFFVFPFPTKPSAVFYLAEPIWPPKYQPDTALFGPVRTETVRGDRVAWLARSDGDVYPAVLAFGPPNVWYRQVTAPTPIPDLSPPIIIDKPFADHLTAVTGLPGMFAFSNKVVEELRSAGRLPKATGKDSNEEQHEAIARGLASYLRHSGQFQYSMIVEKPEGAADPIEDFVLRVRRGPCNRFASALTLMLRCQRIPARIVLGYQGAESRGDGTYVVRQSHAHSWVECLVQRRGTDGQPTWHWLVLDPTPGGGSEEHAVSAFSQWVDDAQVAFGNFFRMFVLDLTPEKQLALRDQLLATEPSRWMWAGPMIVAGASLIVWWLRRSLKAKAATRQDTTMDQLMRLAETRLQLVPQPGWTPNDWLAGFAPVSPTADLAEAASRIVQDHNLRCYAGEAGDQVRAREDLETIRRGLALQR
ncbi:MAG: DUF3488 and transglutaminase-like domain-containing protein, partial [Gemmataceae bacterium]|nr:DUF3488 and transglutaminase-like domain-containing protein [Gemmataceae bacterium]